MPVATPVATRTTPPPMLQEKQQAEFIRKVKALACCASNPRGITSVISSPINEIAIFTVPSKGYEHWICATPNLNNGSLSNMPVGQRIENQIDPS